MDYNSIVDIRRFSELLQGKMVQFPEISLIYLFGSQAEGQAGPKSDIDLGIVIDSRNDEIATASRLAYQLKAALPDQSFDVVPLIYASIELKHAVISKGVCLFERDVSTRVEYEVGVMNRYSDYLPILRAYKEEILRGENDGKRIQRYREAFKRTERTISKVRSHSG